MSFCNVSGEIKPRLRGVLHQYACVAVLSAGTILVVEAPTRPATLATLVYVAAAVFQFFISALYHTPNWPPNIKKVFMRIDHSAIYVLIAATYTPLVLIPLRDSDLAGQLLMRVWLAAAAGVGKTLCWPQAPKQLSAIIYVVMGHMVLPYLPIMAQAVEPPVVMLVAAGGVMYTLGALIYAAGWPNPFPQWFGFHEVFHALVIMASICHFSAIYSSVVKMSHLPGPLPVL